MKKLTTLIITTISLLFLFSTSFAESTEGASSTSVVVEKAMDMNWNSMTFSDSSYIMGDFRWIEDFTIDIDESNKVLNCYYTFIDEDDKKNYKKQIQIKGNDFKDLIKVLQKIEIKKTEDEQGIIPADVDLSSLSLVDKNYIKYSVCVNYPDYHWGYKITNQDERNNLFELVSSLKDTTKKNGKKLNDTSDFLIVDMYSASGYVKPEYRWRESFQITIDYKHSSLYCEYYYTKNDEEIKNAKTIDGALYFKYTDILKKVKIIKNKEEEGPRPKDAGPSNLTLSTSDKKYTFNLKFPECHNGWKFKDSEIQTAFMELTNKIKEITIQKTETKDIEKSPEYNWEMVGYGFIVMSGEEISGEMIGIEINTEEKILECEYNSMSNEGETYKTKFISGEKYDSLINLLNEIKLIKTMSDEEIEEALEKAEEDIMKLAMTGFEMLYLSDVKGEEAAFLLNKEMDLGTAFDKPDQKDELAKLLKEIMEEIKSSTDEDPDDGDNEDDDEPIILP